MTTGSENKSLENEFNEFWAASDDALFSEKIVAPAIGKSVAWLQRARWAGNGPRYFKLGHNVRYRKRDVRAWMGDPVKSTMEGGSAA